MPVLGTVWRGPGPCQVWWFLVVPARVCCPPSPSRPIYLIPPLSEIQLTFCSTSQWMGTGQFHQQPTQSSHTSLFDLSCRVQCFHYLPKHPQPTPSPPHSSPATSSFICGHVSLVLGRGECISGGGGDIFQSGEKPFFLLLLLLMFLIIMVIGFYLCMLGLF